MDDELYMRQALALACLAEGDTSPNPMVGAVIVSADGEVVGEGYHHKAGQPHAEINALKEAKKLARGGTIYVTLEPCSHFGRTGPCCEAIIAAGLKRVVAAVEDPNPKVAGNGFTRCGDRGYCGRMRRRVTSAQREVFSLDRNRQAFCFDEICNDFRR